MIGMPAQQAVGAEDLLGQHHAGEHVRPRRGPEAHHVLGAVEHRPVMPLRPADGEGDVAARIPPAAEPGGEGLRRLGHPALVEHDEGSAIGQRGEQRGGLAALDLGRAAAAIGHLMECDGRPKPGGIAGEQRPLRRCGRAAPDRENVYPHRTGHARGGRTWGRSWGRDGDCVGGRIDMALDMETTARIVSATLKGSVPGVRVWRAAVDAAREAHAPLDPVDLLGEAILVHGELLATHCPPGGTPLDEVTIWRLRDAVFANAAHAWSGPFASLAEAEAAVAAAIEGQRTPS